MPKSRYLVPGRVIGAIFRALSHRHWIGLEQVAALEWLLDKHPSNSGFPPPRMAKLYKFARLAACEFVDFLTQASLSQGKTISFQFRKEIIQIGQSYLRYLLTGHRLNNFLSILLGKSSPEEIEPFELSFAQTFLESVADHDEMDRAISLRSLSQVFPPTRFPTMKV